MQPQDSAAVADFYASAPVFTRFEEITDAKLYVPLPDDWLLGLTDVKSSTAAIARGGYKSVNMAGASVVAAVGNALGTHDFPFVFGGDGASFAVPPQHAALAGEALAACIAYAQEELGMSLRAALVPVSAVRAAGLDVRLARFAPSPDVQYAMFSGGGIAWAEAAMKRGAYAIASGPPGARPDLSGLSCRFSEIPAVRGTIMSLLVVPAVSPDATYRDFITRLVELIESSPDVSRPVPDGAGDLRWPPEGLELEVRATRRAGFSPAGDRALSVDGLAHAWHLDRKPVSVRALDRRVQCRGAEERPAAGNRADVGAARKRGRVLRPPRRASARRG